MMPGVRKNLRSSKIISPWWQGRGLPFLLPTDYAIAFSFFLVWAGLLAECLTQSCFLQKIHYNHFNTSLCNWLHTKVWQWRSSTDHIFNTECSFKGFYLCLTNRIVLPEEHRTLFLVNYELRGRYSILPLAAWQRGSAVAGLSNLRVNLKFCFGIGGEENGRLQKWPQPD